MTRNHTDLIDISENKEVYNIIHDKDLWISVNNYIKDVIIPQNKHWNIFTSKIKSEIMSTHFIPIALKEYFKNNPILKIDSGKVDGEPDIIINDVNKLELKVAKCNDNNNVTWRGGALSKRVGTFIFISWNWTNVEKGEFSFFVSSVFLNGEDDWIKPTKNYYAPTMPISYFLDKLNINIILGDTSKSAKGHSRLKLYEKINN